MITMNREETLDLFQNVWLKCYLSFKKLRNEKNFGAWLKKILFHTAIDYVREKKKTTEIVELDEWPGKENIDTILQKIDIEKILKKLDLEERLLLQLYFLEGYTAKEIAEWQGYNLSTVKMKIHRIIKKLKRKYK